MIGGFLFPVGIFLCALGFFLGFKSEIAKMHIQSSKYIQQENKEDLKDIANTSAEISSEAITTITKAVKEGTKDKKFCKYCGAEIDGDSVFCSKCGNVYSALCTCLCGWHNALRCK
jgi:hypothetical protein